jgi:hypothetical protein
MNRAVSKRIISKQEAVVLLGDLDLTYCTETIENVSISNSKAVSVTAGDSNGPKTFIKEYKDRPEIFDLTTVHEFYHITRNGHQAKTNKKLMIPHFVGINGTPRYPVTDDYARHTLIVHRPWRVYPKQLNWQDEFERFINSPECPVSAKMSYQRVFRRYIDKMTNYEPKAQEGDHTGNVVAEDDEELMLLVGLKNGDEYDFDDALFQQLDKGLSFEWDKPAKVLSRCGGCANYGPPPSSHTHSLLDN